MAGHPPNIAAQNLAALDLQTQAAPLIRQSISPAQQRVIEKGAETKFRGGPLSFLANRVTKDRRVAEAAVAHYRNRDQSSLQN